MKNALKYVLSMEVTIRTSVFNVFACHCSYQLRRLSLFQIKWENIGMSTDEIREIFNGSS